MLAEGPAGIVAQCIGRIRMVPRRVPRIDVEPMRTISGVGSLEKERRYLVPETVVEQGADRPAVYDSIGRIGRAVRIAWSVQNCRARKSHALAWDGCKQNMVSHIAEGQTVG